MTEMYMICDGKCTGARAVDVTLLTRFVPGPSLPPPIRQNMGVVTPISRGGYVAFCHCRPQVRYQACSLFKKHRDTHI